MSQNGKTYLDRGNLTGTEHFLVGLSPSYWAHIPLSVSQVLDLKAIEGILCLRNNENQVPWVPVTKCILVGVVVAMDVRSESTVYTIDDGTGFIDCVHWTDHAASVLENFAEDSSISKGLSFVSLGNLVRVLGRIIHCSSISDSGGGREEEGEGDIEFANEPTSILEIHVSMIQPTSFCAEIDQWKRCSVNCRLDEMSHSVSVFHKLGPRARAQIMDPDNLPPSDDDGAWRLFGIRCRCKLPFKNKLLYCHCIAKFEPLDPYFVFRDSLLQKLLHLESTIEKNDQDLRFQFHDLKADVSIAGLMDSALKKSARAHIAEDTTPNSHSLPISKERLFRRTIQALKDDGIIYLILPPSDTYMLISRHRVLERDCKRNSRPEYFASIPKARIELVKRSLARQNNQVQNHHDEF